MNTVAHRLLRSVGNLRLNIRAMSSAAPQTSKSKHELFVIGHRNPDTDAITAAIVYTDFLRRMNVNATAYRLGDLNNETTFVLRTAGVQVPDMLPEHLPEGTNIALVDHNESELLLLFVVIVEPLLIPRRSTVDEESEENARHARDRSP